MRKLALSDEILMKVEKPARYIGNEINVAIKNPAEIDIRFAMCFPDVYDIGMSHLGIRIIYDMLNKFDGVYCERVYSPWTDLDAIMRSENIPLFTLETQQPVKLMDFLGITLQYEMCYTNVLQILDLSGIPLYASERGDDCPIVIGGGPCAYNPEPVADFFDLFYIGEGETAYGALIEAYRQNKKEGGGRREFLEKAARIGGMYVPAFYNITYNDDGTIKEFKPNNPAAPEKVRRETVSDMSDTYYPSRPIVPLIQTVQDRGVLEIQRGCMRGCRFCQAGFIYRPKRERSLDFLKKTAREIIESTGYDEISLSSLSSSDYSKLGELIEFLTDEFKDKGINISLPSLRIDAFSLDIMGRIQDIKKSSLTFAPEAATQRLRDVINKGLTEEDIMNGSALAFKGGWNRVKLYFMLGLPTERIEDMEGIAVLADKIARSYYDLIPKEERKGKVNIVASSSFFVPKPFTPFQWASMCSREEFIKRANIVNNKVRDVLNRKSIKHNWHEADVSMLEGLLARGDRKLSKVIENAYKNGCMYDAWPDNFVYEKWIKAIDDAGICADFYTIRERGSDEIFPWDFIDIGVTKSFLRREYDKALRGETTPNCSVKCSGCGASAFAAKDAICKIEN